MSNDPPDEPWDEDEEFGPAEAVVAEIHSEIVERMHRGENVTVDEYMGRYPELRDEISRMIELQRIFKAARKPPSKQDEQSREKLIDAIKKYVGLSKAESWIATRFLHGRKVTIEQVLKRFDLPDESEVRDHIAAVIEVCSRMHRKSQG